ncbi:NYN domain-containing protein, partial [Acinetobacter baumannii]
DFTPLASRIRESGLVVYGVGRKQTPEAFRKACDKFIYVENLIEEDKTSTENKSHTETKDSAKEPVIKPSEKETALNIDRTTLNLIYK